MFAVWATLRGIKLPDWNYFDHTPTRKIKGRFDELSKTRVFKESIPDWIDQLGLQELDEATWSKEMTYQNKQAEVILRTNTLKTSKKDLKAQLEVENIPTHEVPQYEDALVLDEKANVFKTCLLYTSPSPRDKRQSRMPSSA